MENDARQAFHGGGAVAAFFGKLALRHCTVTGNRAEFGTGGVVLGWQLPAIIENCVIAGNTSGARGPDVDAPSPVTSTGVNCIGNTADSTGWSASDLLNVPPNLLPLGHYGGPTQTMPPATGSPLINAALVTGDSPVLDQRGAPRPHGAPDIGAVEWGEFNRAPEAPPGYEDLGDLTRPHDLTAPVSYEPLPANPPSPVGQESVYAIDNTTSNHYRHGDGDGAGLDIELLFAPSRLAGLALLSSAEFIQLDPARFVLLGHAADGTFPLLAEGVVSNFTSRVQMQTFHFATPTAPFRKFRLLFPATQGGGATALQIGDVRLMGLAEDPSLRFVDTCRTGGSPDEVRATYVTQPGKTYRVLRSTDGVNFTLLHGGVPANSGRQAEMDRFPHALLKVEEE